MGKPAQRILALDLGTSCGWALSPHESGVVDLSPRRFDGAGMRFVTFRQFLRRVLDGVEIVYFEEVRRHLGVDAAHVYGGLMAVLTEECEERRIPYQGIPVGTVKKHFTGNGAAGKELMVESARRRGWAPTGHDHADALALWDYARTLNGEGQEP